VTVTSDDPVAPGGIGSAGAPEPPRTDVDARAPLRVALVLGSGGARGYAHIGVVDVLREAGVEIAAVSGSSMGALVGGLHAAGRLAEYTEWASSVTRIDIVRMLDLTISKPGTIRGERIFRIVAELLEDVAIEDLPIPFTAVAVDLLTSREVWFQEGSAALAIRASTAIPSFFVPVVLHDRVLVDGGLLNPVPVAPVAAVHADRIVAVSLSGRASTRAAPLAESAGSSDAANVDKRLRSAAGRWLEGSRLDTVRRYVGDERMAAVRAAITAGPTSDEPRPPAPGAPPDADLRARDVMLTSLEVMQDALGRHRLADYPPDVLITVRRDACRTLDFHRADEMIAVGRALAEEALPSILEPDTVDVDRRSRRPVTSRRAPG
jgi:NTE family protein